MTQTQYYTSDEFVMAYCRRLREHECQSERFTPIFLPPKFVLIFCRACVTL